MVATVDDETSSGERQKASVVHVVDDDDAVLRAFQSFCDAIQVDCRCYGSGLEFLDAFDDSLRGCVVLDLRMPSMDGIEVQRRLAERGSRLPVVFLTAHGAVEPAVEAVRAGAFDFLEKPPHPERLRQVLLAAIAEERRRLDSDQRHHEYRSRYESLTKREKQVCQRLVRGLAGKEIAADLDISYRTMEKYRAGVMRKMQTSSLADLTLIAVVLELVPAGNPNAN